MEIQFLGAAETVTGSATLISYNGKKYLIDCGLYQGPKEIREKNWQERFAISSIDAIILTHAHIDHSGYIPRFYKEGFRGKIYCSKPTKDLLGIMLPDSGYLQEEDAKYANQKKYSKHEPALPLYSEKDARKSLHLLEAVANYNVVELQKGLSFEFLRAGHILGSNIVKFYYSSPNGSKILSFSGDLGHYRSFILRGPDTLKESDFLVLEGTYGNRSQPRYDVLVKFAEIINKVINRGGTLLIPAFTVGRTQELLFILRKLEEEKKIPSTNVYLDSPMALDATSVYLSHREDLKDTLKGDSFEHPLCPRCFIPVRNVDESMMLCMNNDPKIVISAAGMLTGGRILHHLKAKLPNPQNGVVFVGYQVEGTKGDLLKNGLLTINLHHESIQVEAEIFNLDAMSAHADSDELVKWVKDMQRKPKKIFLNHGSLNALKALKYRLDKELGLEVVIPKDQEKFDIS